MVQPRRSYRSILFCLLPAIALGCRGGSSPATQSTTPAPAAKVENAKPEGDLATVTLSPEARKHLAIETMKVTLQTVRLTRTVGGELIVPPGRSVVLTAPIAGTLAAGRTAAVGPVARGDVLFDLIPLQQSDRDVRAEADRQLGEAEARLTQAAQRLHRFERLLKEGSASVRSVEDARADNAVAAAAAAAARKRVESVSRVSAGASGEVAIAAPFDGFVMALKASAGQVVAAGTPVAELQQTDRLWIRVPVFAGDLRSIDAAQPVLVAALGQEASGPWREGRRVAGPPAADPASATVDLFFELPATRSPAMRPGERLAVRLPLKTTDRALAVPQAAIVYDINGGTWVYEERSPNRFARRRVELAGPSGANVIVSRGLTEGLTLVIVGAAELYGTEFYVSK